MKIDKELVGVRVDYALAFHPSCKDLGTRARKRLCDNGQVFVNGRVAKAAYKLLLGQEIEVKTIEIKEDKIHELQILKEDENFLAFYKPSGIASAKVIVSGNVSMEEEILKQYPHAIMLNRLDTQTSGILMCAKNENAEVKWKEEQEEGNIEKKYYALVEGEYDDYICIDSIIITKRNKVKTIDRLEFNDTRYTWASPLEEEDKAQFEDFLAQHKGCSIADCMIKRGVRHQIRCHLASINYPLVNDFLYANRADIEDIDDEVSKKLAKESSFFLHNYKIESEIFTVECSLALRFNNYN